MTEMDNRIEKEKTILYLVIGALNVFFYYFFFFERKKGINFVTTRNFAEKATSYNKNCAEKLQNLLSYVLERAAKL